MNVTPKYKILWGRVENIVGKGKNAGYQHFVFSTMFLKGILYRIGKSRDCVVQN